MLLRFSDLKRIHLSTICMSCLDDDALGSIVRSLLHLEELVIGTRVLGLVFDATKLCPTTTQMLGGEVCNTNITSLRVGFSPIEQTPGVSVALWEILPCLSEIHLEFCTHTGPGRDARMTKCGDVMKYIDYHKFVWKPIWFLKS
ncbi:hypothetical protein AZE42_13191 [Rhizopogon vesiculosus]|uniref:Uncharacterized protein n=1 Tax=Rhizopogon vesiculosus TaxID=180088 RepID=A0A1J8QJQ7_9AGAM|nr:hypothetical protein AZE42_13191 [Rhizopogon vesiculosus]